MQHSEIHFQLPKPTDWYKLPLYKKYIHYGRHLNNQFSPYADKLVAKEIVRQACGTTIGIPRVIRVLRDWADIQPSDLNHRTILKASHGSGWCIDMAKLPYKTERENIMYIKSNVQKWNRPYSTQAERHYAFIRPRFFLEEKIQCRDNGMCSNATDYKFFCFHGEPKYLLIRRNGKRSFYWVDAEWTPMRLEEPRFDNSRFKLLEPCIDACKTLATPFEFVRLDFYMGADARMYFSEFTFVPLCGQREFSESLELQLGSFWK